jgi:hypothetical protein
MQKTSGLVLMVFSDLLLELLLRHGCRRGDLPEEIFAWPMK